MRGAPPAGGTRRVRRPYPTSQPPLSKGGGPEGRGDSVRGRPPPHPSFAPQMPPSPLRGEGFAGGHMGPYRRPAAPPRGRSRLIIPASCRSPERSCPFCPSYDLDDIERILTPAASGRRGAPDFIMLGRTEFALRNSPPAAPNSRATWRAPPLAAFGTKFVTSLSCLLKQSCPFCPSYDLDDIERILFR